MAGLRLAVYCRVSTERQATDGLSLGAQERSCRAWCEAMGHDAVRVFRDEGVSGKSLDRPGFTNALFLVSSASSFDGLVVASLDRLTRSVRDFCDLVDGFRATGKALVIVREQIDTSSAAGRMVANIFATFAQYERELIGERVKAGMAEAKRQGKHVGRPPVELDPTVLERIRSLHAEHRSCRVVAELLGAPWTGRRVQLALQRA